GEAVMRQALYRTYRPRDFDEVVGQEHVTTVLKNELAAGTPSHAYLFVGSRGTGKTSCAKLVAKAVNCLDLHAGNPCGVCDRCRGVDDGSLLDVVEIDAASNNGVENIRDLRDEAIFTPSVAKYRVYIIDEVHMLSTSAFNALLKILEEPPAHVIFVLATTEVHKVLPTIISRCQRFDFSRIESVIIADRLLEVAHREGFLLDGGAAALIARLSDGGMRDALSLLDVCAARGGQSVTEQTVADAAGLAGSVHLMELTDIILNGDASAVLIKLAELMAKSLEPQRLCEQLIGHWRDLMLVKTVKEPLNLLGCLPEELEPLRKQAARTTLSELLHGLTVLQDATSRMGRSANKRAEAELALVSLSEPSAKTGMDALMARIERLEAVVRRSLVNVSNASTVSAVPMEPVSTVPSAPTVTPVGTTVTPQPSLSVSAEKSQMLEDAQIQKTAVDNAPMVQQQETVASIPFPQWQQVLEQLSVSNASVAGLLIGSNAFCDGKRVLIDVKNPLLLDMLKNNEYTRASIKQAIAMVTGRQYAIGPYHMPKSEKTVDPLDELIERLPLSHDIIIE
ncbi:MAG: DNA polymerase III subunit gamma/tau, partial [Oscillospiraceae bacterium]